MREDFNHGSPPKKKKKTVSVSQFHPTNLGNVKYKG